MYSTSSVAVVIAVLVIIGESFTLLTVIVKLSVAVEPLKSVAVITTEWSPTSELVGVPVKIPVDGVNVNQVGIVVPSRLTISPLSSSLVVTI